jgi:hypothetical protein
MKRLALLLSLLSLAIGCSLASASPAAKAAGSAPAWSMDATVIEACSCPMFCNCYFGGGQPASHHDMGMKEDEHYCKFNNAYKVSKGSYKGVSLDGAKFWLAGDLGGDFTKGQMDWCVLTYDKSLSPAQREGIAAICGHIFPVKWNSFKTSEGAIEWTAGATESRATIDGGKTAEVTLKRGGFGEKGKKTVIEGLQYWGVDHNDGFVLMPNSIEAWRGMGKTYEFKGTNGFMTTIHIADHGTESAAGKTSGF